MCFKKFFKKVCTFLTAVLLGLTLIFAVAPVQTVDAAKPTKAERELDEYLSSHSMKELNGSQEGQTLLCNYYKEKKGVNVDPNKNARLQSIMTSLSNAINKIDPSITELPYVYFVNNDTSLNAFCAFSHVMSVNSGTFDQIVTDDELAVIIGHELGHGQKNHAYKGFKSAQQKVLWANIAAIAIGGGQITNIVGSILLNQSIVHGTKSQEKQADNLAFDYILLTNYNPGACAAVWQRFIDISGTAIQNKAELFFTPSDHPNNVARRDNYVKKLFEYSGKHVTAKDGILFIDDKNFIKTAASNGMSAEERSYFILGNLAKAYNNGQNKYEATVSNGTVYLGNQEIITPASDDEPAQTIADKLNAIK